MAKSVQEFEASDSAKKAAESVEAYQESTEDLVGEKLVLNMGPSHPATHGVLRVILELDGEVITKAIPDVGFLHRGDEKIAENMQYNQFVPYTDRLDYLAPLANNVAYALAVEKLMGLGAAAARPGRPGHRLRTGTHFRSPSGRRRLRDGCGCHDGVSLHLHSA